MPIPSCPPEIRALMLFLVTWEPFTGFDGHADPAYGLPQQVNCYKEAHGMMQGGLEVTRKADETTADPDWDLFFSGDNPQAQSFTLYDRFTVPVVGGGYTTQPSSINTINGPNFDNRNPWLIVVAV